MNTESLSNKIFALLKGNGLKIVIFDEDGQETVDPAKGKRFFITRPNIMITISDDLDSIELSKGSGVADKTKDIERGVKMLANEFQMNYGLKVFGKTIQPKDYAYQVKKQMESRIMENNVKPINHHLLGMVQHNIKLLGQASAEELAQETGTDASEIQPVLNRLVSTGKIVASNNTYGNITYSLAVDEAVMENYKSSISESFSKMFGSKKTSQQTLENVKILVKHKVPVSEEIKGSRTRQISAVFLETNGERVRFQYNYLPGARAMARHLSHGGEINDNVGTYITETIGNLLKLKAFTRYVSTNKLINENSGNIVGLVKENIDVLRTELRHLAGASTYKSVRARVELSEKEQLSEGDVADLKDLFTIKRFDEEFSDVLPMIKKMVREKHMLDQRIEEAANKAIYVGGKAVNTTPIFEFANDNVKLGFKVSELSARIMENSELSEFIHSIGVKLTNECKLNVFEHNILSSVLENITLHKPKITVKGTLKESHQIDEFFNKFNYRF